MGKHRKRKRRSITPLVVSGAVLGGTWFSLVTAHAADKNSTEFNAGAMKLIDDVPVQVRADRAAYRRALPPKPPKPLGQLAIQAAMSKLGVPYVWGAKGPNQFDCSGLTQWSWKQVGVTIGPDTYTQIKQGTPVPKSQVQQGDLIFPFIGHVQLAISPTEVIEAPGRGMVVRIRSMPTSFVARRVA